MSISFPAQKKKKFSQDKLRKWTLTWSAVTTHKSYHVFPFSIREGLLAFYITISSPAG